jgi:hypothetical protein
MILSDKGSLIVFSKLAHAFPCSSLVAVLSAITQLALLPYVPSTRK